MSMMSIFLLVGGLIGIRFSKMEKSGNVITISLFFFFLLFSSILLVADKLTGNGFDESVVFHLAYGIGGAGVLDFLQVIS